MIREMITFLSISIAYHSYERYHLSHVEVSSRERVKEHDFRGNSLFTIDSPSVCANGRASETLIHYVGSISRRRGRIGVRQNRLPVFDRGEIWSDIPGHRVHHLCLLLFISLY